MVAKGGNKLLAYVYAGPLTCEDTLEPALLMLWLEKATIGSCWTNFLTLE